MIESADTGAPGNHQAESAFQGGTHGPHDARGIDPIDRFIMDQLRRHRRQKTAALRCFHNEVARLSGLGFSCRAIADWFKQQHDIGISEDTVRRYIGPRRTVQKNASEQDEVRGIEQKITQTGIRATPGTVAKGVKPGRSADLDDIWAAVSSGNALDGQLGSKEPA